MNDPSGWQWVPVEAVLDLYAEQIEEHGGRAGLRDENLLHSALARPVNSLHYEPEGATACRLAAAYAFGLACNHAFVDGNKLTVDFDKAGRKMVLESFLEGAN